MEYDHRDIFPFDYEPNESPFSVTTIIVLSIENENCSYDHIPFKMRGISKTFPCAIVKSVNRLKMKGIAWSFFFSIILKKQ